MWYDFIMNKDVIYIEPEDDITDIITKIENSKSKIIALVPPKKASVFRSVVNAKLITKAAKTAEKNVVLVTTDPSIVRIAASTKIPVSKSLQSAPVIPKLDSDEGTVVTEELEETTEAETKKSGEEEVVEEETKKNEEEKDDVDKKEESSEEEAEKKTEEKAKEKSEKKKSNNPFAEWLSNHKKLVIFGCVGVFVLILLLVWMLVISPRVELTVTVKTDPNNFSENITFVSELSAENANEGKFYITEKKIETSDKVEFEATGKKNVGEKATGELVIIASLPYRGGSVTINTDDTFVNGGFVFMPDKATTLTFDGENTSVCANEDVSMKEFREQGCRIYDRITVTAAAPGEAYNLAATETGWGTTANVGVYSDKAMAGGTDKNITVVSQEDIDKAKESLSITDRDVNKKKLLEEIKDSEMAIDASFSQSSNDVVSTPAVGEPVEEGKKATLTATTTAKISIIDKTKVEEFIRMKAKLAEGQKIYEIRNPFIENLAKTDAGYTAKLKATYSTGPEITENSIILIRFLRRG